MLLLNISQLEVLFNNKISIQKYATYMMKREIILMRKNTSFYVNVTRSTSVRNKFKHLRENLPLPYKVIGEKTKMSKATLSQFLNGTRDFNDNSLDRLEPIIDNYLKLLELQDELMKG